MGSLFAGGPKFKLFAWSACHRAQVVSQLTLISLSNK
jgi:hypothetical protein